MPFYLNIMVHIPLLAFLLSTGHLFAVGFPYFLYPSPELFCPFYFSLNLFWLYYLLPLLVRYTELEQILIR